MRLEPPARSSRSASRSAASPREGTPRRPRRRKRADDSPSERSLTVFGALVLTGLDHAVETALIAAMPDWLANAAAAL